MDGDSASVPDRLSGIPDEILHEILAHLPMDDAVRTSVLSSRWRRLWSTNPVLNFNCLSWGRSNDAVVDHCLRLCASAEKLRFLSFSVDECPDLLSTADRWISFAAGRTVEKLRFFGDFDGEDDYVTIPPSLFCCTSLRFLHVSFCTFLTFPSSAAGFRSLETLSLDNLSVVGEALTALISACPSLRRLSIRDCDLFGPLVISSPTLGSLDLYECPLDGLEIEYAPQLWRLALRCDLSMVGSLKAAPNLEDATLFSRRAGALADPCDPKQFTSGISHVKFLTINYLSLQK